MSKCVLGGIVDKLSQVFISVESVDKITIHLETPIRKFPGLSGRQEHAPSSQIVYIKLLMNVLLIHSLNSFLSLQQTSVVSEKS